VRVYNGRGLGTEPLVRGSEVKPPDADRFLSTVREVQTSVKISPFLHFCMDRLGKFCSVTRLFFVARLKNSASPAGGYIDSCDDGDINAAVPSTRK
jgi:hypothetical protein